MKFSMPRIERKERAPDPPRIGFDRTPARIRTAVVLASIGVVGFLVLWVAQTTGELRIHVDLDWQAGLLPKFDWDIAARLDVLPLMVLSIVSFGIVYWSKAWVSYFASTPWADWFSKWGSLVIGLGASLAIIMGGLEVNQHTRQEDMRGALVGEQSAEAGRAQIASQIESIEERLAGMRDQERVGVYAAIAASVGAAAYDAEYLSAEALARTDPARRDLVRRARGAAVAADALEAQKTTLAGQLATAAPAAATAAVVEMRDPVSNFINSLGPWRIVVLVMVMDFVLLFGSYFADKAEERQRARLTPEAEAEPVTGHVALPPPDDTNPLQDMAHDAAYAVFDAGGTAEEAEQAARDAVAAGPQKTAKDAETNEDAVWVGGFWRKKAERKGAKVKSDGVEAGVFDASRTGQTAKAASNAVDDVSVSERKKNTDDQHHGAAPQEALDGGAGHGVDSVALTVHTPESTSLAPTLSPEDLDALYANEIALPSGEGVMVADDGEEERLRAVRRRAYERELEDA